MWWEKIASLTCIIKPRNDQEIASWKFAGECKFEDVTRQDFHLGGGVKAGSIRFAIELFVKEYSDAAAKSDLCLNYQASIIPANMGGRLNYPDTRYPLNIKAEIFGAIQGSKLSEKIFQVNFEKGDLDILKGGGELIKTGTEFFTLGSRRHDNYNVVFEVLPLGKVP